jgi:lipid II:glycine glycyltransferase (peptidoglycan interpeptide bridge formation enzyme)
MSITSQGTNNALIQHPLQTYEWGEFRKKTGIKVIHHAHFQLTIHKIPKTPWTIGYLPKGEYPTEKMIKELREIGKQENCIFIQLEPNVIKAINGNNILKKTTTIPNLAYRQAGLVPAAHPLFTKHTFQLDLTKSEEELLKTMHSKARYNIKIAQKHNVLVKEDNSKNAFERYWQLTQETTTRQKFYAHTKHYHQLQWETFSHDTDTKHLTSHLFTAAYKGEILTTLLFFVYHDTLYYPYGASSDEHRNVMHSNLAMWEGIRFGKKLGLKTFDMWGAMGQNPDTKDPWYGFHNFKQKFGPDHIEFIGSYDLIIHSMLYKAYKVADKVRWMGLKGLSFRRRTQTSRK